MEKYDCSLSQYIRKRNLFEKLQMSDRLNIIEKIGNGLNYIHNEIKATHFDLKLDNIMINLNDTDDWDRQTVKIIDFGYCCSSGAHQTRAGTPGWASPEQIVYVADER